MFRPLAFACAAAVLGTAASASAHVTVHPTTAIAGSYAELTFVIGHGCQGSATVALRVTIPDGVGAVRPQMKPGWTISTKTRPLDPAARTGEGHVATETVDEVDWQGGPLPDSLYDTFGVMMKLPDAAGTTLYFPAIQECQQGTRRWTERPAPGQAEKDLREPAPRVRLTPAAP